VLWRVSPEKFVVQYDDEEYPKTTNFRFVHQIDQSIELITSPFQTLTQSVPLLLLSGNVPGGPKKIILADVRSFLLTNCVAIPTCPDLKNRREEGRRNEAFYIPPPERGRTKGGREGKVDDGKFDVTVYGLEGLTVVFWGVEDKMLEIGAVGGDKTYVRGVRLLRRHKELDTRWICRAI
jgi:hypothetical protein